MSIMTDYKPVLFDSMEYPAETINKADLLSIAINGNKLSIGNTLWGTCHPFITLPLSPSTMKEFSRKHVLEKEAESFGPIGEHITLIYNNRIVKLTEDVNLELYSPEIEILGPRVEVYGKEGDCGTGSGTAKLIIYGEMPESIKTINTGMETKDIKAIELGDKLFEKIYGGSPETTYIGSEGYFLSGKFHSVQTNDDYNPDIDSEFIRAHILGENVDFTVGLSDSREDLTLDVIVFSESLKNRITDETVRQSVASFSKK